MTKQLKKAQVFIYTNGSCTNCGTDDARGGWAAILKCNGKEKEISGCEKGTTSNRMELEAMINAAKTLRIPCEVNYISDSQYAYRCFESIREWRDNDWKTKAGSTPANLDLLLELVEVGIKGHHRFKFMYINSKNETGKRCDKLAYKQMKSLEVLHG